MEVANASEIMAAQLQLEELRGEMQCTLDAQLALRTALGDACGNGAGDASGTAWDELLGEQHAIAEQIASLAAFAASFEDQCGAARLQAEEDANAAVEGAGSAPRCAAAVGRAAAGGARQSPPAVPCVAAPHA